MSPAVLLPCRALQRVPPQGCPHLCCFPPKYYVMSLCSPRMSPSMLLPSKAPLCVPGASPGPHLLASRHRASLGRGTQTPPPQLPAPFWAWAKTKGDGEAAEWRQNWGAVGSPGAFWHGDASPPWQDHSKRGPPGGFTPGRGFASRRLGWQGPRAAEARGGCCGVLGQPPACATRVPTPARGSSGPPGQGPPGQGPAGCISAFLFLILLFSYRSTYLRMTVIEAFIKG